MKVAGERITYPELIRYVAKEVRPLKPVTIPTTEAIDYVVAADVKALKNVPEDNEAFMDGYAIIAPVKNGEILKLKDESSNSLSYGEALMVRCGEELPEGSNSVLPLEGAEVINSFVKVLQPLPPGYGVRVRGQEVKEGEFLVKRGNVLKPELAKALVNAGINNLQVYPKPKVAIYPTGDEFVRKGEIEVTGHVVTELIKLLGAEVKYLTPLPDNEAVIAEAVRENVRAYDAIVIVGGTGPSWKDKSWVSRKFVEGVREVFHGIKVVPGRTTSMYYIDGCPVITLPGFLTAAYAATLMVIAPVVFRLMGMAPRPALKPLRTAKLVGESLINPGSELRLFFLKSIGFREVMPLKPARQAYRVLLDSDSFTVLGGMDERVEGEDVLVFSKYPSLI